VILIVSCVFPPEPVVSAQISEDLAYALSENHEVVVICPHPTRPAGSRYTEAVEWKKPFKRIVLDSYVHPGGSIIGRMFESISLGISANRFIKKHKGEISLIYANTWPLFSQYFATRASKKYNIPLVVHIQDIYPETITDSMGVPGRLLKNCLMPIDRYVLRNARLVVTIGLKMRDYLSRSRKLNNIALINNWQDESRFTKVKPGYSDRFPFTFLFLGSLSPSANIENIICAFGRSSSSQARLVIAGDGNSKLGCMDMAEKFKDKNIEFIDAPGNKAAEIIAQSNVCILPLKKGSGSYSIPSKLAGYMLSGKPVLAAVDTDSDTAETVRDADCGWITDSENIAVISGLIDEIQKLPESHLEVIGKNGHEYAIRNLSKGANLKKMIKLIEDELPKG
jgi:glycosyltransferase involved in cell wall biosynthesis